MRLAKRSDGKKAVYLGQMVAYMDLWFAYRHTKIKMLVHVQHGEGGGQAVAAWANKIDRSAQGFDGDVFIRAHDCQIGATKKPKLYPKESNYGEVALLDRTIAYLNTGAATRGYEISKKDSSYIEQKMMRPSSMCWGTVKFKFRSATLEEDPNRNIRCDLKVEI
jgi:hypothetical protein